LLLWRENAIKKNRIFIFLPENSKKNSKNLIFWKKIPLFSDFCGFLQIFPLFPLKTSFPGVYKKWQKNPIFPVSAKSF
jgi:uncharacterized protein (UPF0305 family)